MNVSSALSILLYVSFFNLNNEKYSHLGSKTPYRFFENTNVTEPKFEGCSATKIWLLVRHGTRFPKNKQVQEMKGLEKIRDRILKNSHLSPPITNALKQWKLAVNLSVDGDLAPEGRAEMRSLGLRMQKRFPSLFPARFSNNTYTFKSTTSERCLESARYFAKGLFGGEEAYYDDSPESDFVLKFYNYCRKWQEDVENNPKTYEEQRLFDEDATMTALVDSFNNKLNLVHDKLLLDDIKLMTTMCAFETAWNEGKSVWCSILPLPLLEALDFSNDLSSYYVDGYAYPITYKQACPLFKSMMQHIAGKDNPQTTSINLSHSETILKFLADLGLYNDGFTLKHTHFKIKDRKWIESKLAPFGTNLAFVLYRCGSRKKVAVFYQERLIKLPKCDELCDLSHIQKYYQENLDCQFDQMCK
ncbi:hypothetical protein FQA39_LY05945 [Lamprigera yunnana]|nr:hypothetical protein FQA39_LY05945 [Lamprigera yunnana]